MQSQHTPGPRAAPPPPAQQAEQETLNGHQTRSRQSTRLLIEAAGDLVAEGGYNSMTMAMIGERAGYSAGLPTARFGTKAKLLDALVDRIVTRWSITTVLPRAAGQPGLDALITVLEAIRDQYSRDPRSLRVLYALMFEALGPNEELRQRFITFHREMRTSMAATLHQGITDGSIDTHTDPDTEAQVIIATLRGVGYQWRLDPDTFDPVPALNHLIATTRTRIAAKQDDHANDRSDQR